jgi:NitT/TauT family transport system permease protein
MTVTLAVWEWYGRGVNPIFFSYPTAIAAAVPNMISSGELPTAFLLSMRSLSVGFIAASSFGILLGLAIGRYRIVDLALDTQLVALYSTPTVALIPLLILWFGLGFEAKVAVVFLSAFFPVLLNTQAGVRNVDRSFVDVARVEGGNERQVLTKIVLPASLPFITTGLRLAAGRAVVGMVVAEMFTAISGLGGRIIYYSGQFATAKLLVVVIVLALLGVTLNQLVRILETRLTPWRGSRG